MVTINLGIDIGGTSTKFAIVVNKKIIFKTSIPTDFLNIDNWINAVLKKCEQLKSQYKFKHILIATGGVINRDGLVLNVTHSAKQYRGKNWKKLLDNKFGSNTFLYSINDAKAFAQYQIGNSKYKNFICITIGTGVGLTYIIDKNIIYGKNYIAGEIGSFIWKNNLSVDDYFSATKLGHRINNILGKKGNFKFQNLKNYYIANKNIKKEVDLWLQEFTRFLALNITIQNPEALYISGGISYAGDFLITKIIEEINLHIPSHLNHVTHISFSKIQNDANILGLFYKYKELENNLCKVVR